MDITKAPPSNMDIEKAVLSSMFFDSEVISLVFGIIGADDFYNPSHSEIFKAIAEIKNNGIELDIVALKNQLEKRGTFDSIGGLSTMAELAGYCSSSINAKHYVLEIKRLSEARQILKNIMSLTQDYDKLTTDNIKKILEQAEKTQYVKSYSEKALKNIDDFKTNLRTKKQRVTTGYRVIDKVIGGFRIPSVAMIGAYPSVGKTAFALNIVNNQKKPTLFFSLEMSSDMIYERLASSELRIDYNLFSTQDLSEEQYCEIETYIETVKGKGINVFDDVYYIEQQATIISNIKPSLVVVDYIQKVKTHQKTDGRRHEIEYISGMYKQIAKENNCTILLLSQLSRGFGQTHPTMSNLKESGALEADGDYVGILHRPYVTNKDVESDDFKPEEEGYLLMDKNKFGNTGKINLFFEGKYQRFFDNREDYESPF